MNIKQLRAFREVMIAGSVSEAARNLYRTQPAISSLLAGLEDELGCELFARRGRRLYPVPEAHYLFEQADTILSQIESTASNMKSLRDLESGSLRIVAMPGPSVVLLPDLVSRFVDGRDKVNVQLITRSSPQVHQLMATQYYDVGLADQVASSDVHSALTDSEDVACNCLCALPADDPLAGKDVISALDLDNKPLALLQPEHSTRIATEQAFAQYGSTINIRFEMQYFIPLLKFVESNQAYSIIDSLSAASYKLYRGERGNIVFRPFVPKISLIVSLITPAQRPVSNLARAFKTLLRDEIETVRLGMSGV